jgi:hypothetical protein
MNTGKLKVDAGMPGEKSVIGILWFVIHLRQSGIAFPASGLVRYRWSWNNTALPIH